jgi:hypothetical protein
MKGHDTMTSTEEMAETLTEGFWLWEFPAEFGEVFAKGDGHAFSVVTASRQKFLIAVTECPS